jgi:hypothetical protein
MEALQHFKSNAVVTADGERLQVNVMIGIHYHSSEPLRAEKQSVDGHLETFAGDPGSEMNLRIAAGKQLTRFIGNVDFG